MKKIVLVVLSLFVSATATFAQSTVTDSTAAVGDTAVYMPAVQGPSIEFKEQKFDFGNIKQGDVVEHTFLFRNNGSQPLTISNVRTTCGCTATDYPKAPVMPGETASITAKFNSAGKRGPQNKVITVESNAVQGSTQVMIVTTILATK